MPDKSLSKGKKSMNKVSSFTVIAFLLSLTLCFSLVGIMILNRTRVESLTMEQVILEKSSRINDVISKLLYKTQMLSSLVLQSDGEVRNFDRIAATIVDDPAIMNILIAPDGVVSDVYPMEGNEAVIGLDFFAEGAGNKEAVMAKDTGRLVLGGPFNAIQGGQVLVGRLPVFITGPDGDRHFWGLVSVTLKYPQTLDGAGLSELRTKGFAYEIWRINPDTNESQIISTSGHSYNSRTNYIEMRIPIVEAEWYFRVLPVREWYQFPETWASVALSICVSLLVAAVIQNNQHLTVLKDRLEALSNTDPLTGINNRRYFMDFAAKRIERIKKSNGEAFVILFDLDRFKMVNDRYGHQAGDIVLEESAARISNILRPNDLFARYGGEEFIVLATDIDKSSVLRYAERMRMDIEVEPVETYEAPIPITASFGVAPAAPVNKLMAAIALADSALYRAKDEGRNKVVFYECDESEKYVPGTSR